MINTYKRTVPDELGNAIDIVARLVRGNGGRALIVGGAVRDMLTGKKVKDIDIEVFGIEPETLKDVLSTKFDLDLPDFST
jgi:tRNA nucleotidyltransferase/poly(A) polymerase